MSQLSLSPFDPSLLADVHNIDPIIIIGPKKSGKTQCVQDLLKALPPLDATIRLSAANTAGPFAQQSSQEALVEWHDRMNMSVLHSIILEQAAAVATESHDAPHPHMAVVMDNCMGDDQWAKHPTARILFCNSRHFNIHFIVTTEHINSFTSCVFQNASYVFIFGAPEDPSEQEALFERVGSTAFSRQEDFYAALEECTTNYRALVIGMNAKQPVRAVWHGLTDGSLSAYAAENGHLKMLQWLHSQGCPLDATICASAARVGHLEVLKWLRAQGCPWDAWTCAYTAHGGHLEVLKWLQAQGCPWDAWTCAYAAKGGHLEVLKWARERGCPWDAWTCVYAAKGGHLAVLKRVREQGCPWDAWTCVHAAAGGHLEALKWARAQGCPWDARVCKYAAAKGRLEVLKFARAQGCPWDAWTCAYAADNGQLEVLKWLRDQGCPWDEWTCEYAATSGHLEVLKWARAHGAPWDQARCLERSQEHAAVHAWLEENANEVADEK